jgi:hypothetical protein
MDNKKDTNKNNNNKSNNDDELIKKITRSLILAQLKDIEDNKNNPNFRINQTSEFFINDMKDLIGEENFEKIKKENLKY